jgi:hypothetical protein
MATKSGTGGYRWRDSGTGKYLTVAQASRKPPSTVERERIKPSAPPSKGSKN